MQPRNARRNLAVALVGTVILSGLTGCAARPASSGSHHVSVNVNNNGVNVNIDGGRFTQGGNKAAETVQKTFLADKVASLHLNESAGNIEIVPAPEGVNEIHVQATKIVTGPSSVEKLKPLLAKIQATVVLEGDTLVVQASHPQDEFTNNVSVSFSVDYVLTVPPRLAYDLYTGSGEVKLRGIRGGGTIHSNYGNIAATDVGGTLDLSTSSGVISVENAQSAVSIKAHSDYGNLTLKNLGGAIDAKTSSGSITINQAQQAKSLTLHSDYGNIVLDAVGGIVDATTSSGQIFLSNSRIDDHLMLHSDYGNIEAKTVQAVGKALSVQLSTASGSVEYQGDVTDLNLSSSYGAVRAEPTTVLPLHSVDLSTSSGGVDLTLASSVSATIEARTASGNLDLGDNVSNNEAGEQSRSRMLGSGVAPVHLSSDYGAVTLHTK